MATYSNVSKIRTDFHLTQDDEVFERILKRASTMAYNFINSYLDGIYPVPFSTGETIPGAVREISDMITRHVAQAIQLKQPIMLDKKRAAGEMKDALQWLEDIITGKAGIIEKTRLTTRGAMHTMDGYEPIFHVDEAEFHSPDDDLLDDIADARD